MYSLTWLNLKKKKKTRTQNAEALNGFNFLFKPLAVWFRPSAGRMRKNRHFSWFQTIKLLVKGEFNKCAWNCISIMAFMHAQNAVRSQFYVLLLFVNFFRLVVLWALHWHCVYLRLVFINFQTLHFSGATQLIERVHIEKLIWKILANDINYSIYFFYVGNRYAWNADLSAVNLI